MERLKSHREFVEVLKKRRKVSSADIVVHYLVRGSNHSSTAVDDFVDISGDSSDTSRRMGLAVTKAVGNAVKRNHVKRRFRVLARSYEEFLPEHCDIVMRAKPSAYSANFSDLEIQVKRIFSKIQKKVTADSSQDSLFDFSIAQNNTAHGEAR